LEFFDVVIGYGHVNVKATHPTTIEVTKEPYLTPRGDCIIAVKADKAAADLNEGFKKLAKSPLTVIKAIIEVNGLREVVTGRGDERLTFTDPRSMVFRRSVYACSRTVMVKCDKAAADLSRALVSMLKRGVSVRVMLVASPLNVKGT